MFNTEIVNGSEIRNGDIIYNCGYRCTVSEVTEYQTATGPVWQWVLTSCPSKRNPGCLPGCYEGMGAGGNELARITREL